MPNYCSTSELAELRGCTIRHIQQQIHDGDIKAIPADDAANNQKEYLIPLTELTDREQWIYNNRIRLMSGVKPPKEPKSFKPKKTLEEFSAAQREQIGIWKQIIEEWQLYRTDNIGEMKKSEIDDNFCLKIRIEHPDINISKSILYRKSKAYQDGDLSGLVDNRGGSNKGKNKIEGTDIDILSDAFFHFFLDERCLPVSRCYELMKEWTLEFRPELYGNIPCERTFRRMAEALPEAVVVLSRQGEKAMKDGYIPYVERLYEDFEANGIWVADNHTVDFITMGENGRTHRLYLTAFFDAKSGVLVGWNVTENPSSQSTLLALRHGIIHYGIPQYIYVDNGSEFLTHDLGGRGHRRKKDWNKEELPPTILQSLGIKMYNAEVRNAKAKPIERFFGTFKNHISRIMETFCGGTILERPESLKYKLKKGIVPEDQQIRDLLEQLINYDYNVEPYGGKERRYKGMSRIEVWNESAKRTVIRRPQSNDDLNILLARVTKPQVVKRNGVFVNFAGEKLWYSGKEATLWNGDKTVYVRYDPANINEVRVYEFGTDQYLTTWQLNDVINIPYITENNEDIAEFEKTRVAAEKLIRNYKKGLTDKLSSDERVDFLHATLAKAERNKTEGRFHIDMPNSFKPVFSDKAKEENPIFESVDSITIDLDRMNANALKRRNSL